MKPVFKSGHTLRQALTSRRPSELKKGAVYEVPCGGCDNVYISETGRTLKERVREHKYAVKTANMNNGIAAHAWQAQHPVDWEAAKVRKHETNLWKRRVIEAIHIKSMPHTSNLDCGLHLNPIWLPILQTK